MADVPDRSAAFSSLNAVLMLGFKFLAWLNGLGLLLVILNAVGVISSDYAPEWLRLPLLAFSAGMVLCGLGLLWAYLTQASLLNQSLAGYVRRGHWVPLSCMIASYCLSLLSFVAGCWLVVFLAASSYQGGDQTDSGSPDSSWFNEQPAPQPQSADRLPESGLGLLARRL